jgi:hypothetical protein
MKYHFITQKMNHYFVWQNFAVKGSQSKNVVKAPVVTEVTEQLVGLAQPKQWIKVTTQDEVFFAQANHKGIWHLDNPIAQGGTASIVALGAFGKTSKAIEIAVAVPAPSFLDVPVITEQNLWLKGTAEPLSNVVIQHEEAIYQVRADAEGNWEIENPIYWGGSITLYAENAQGLISAIIGLAVLPPLPPSVPNILEDGAYLVGTADINSVVVLRHNGVETRIEVGVDGQWSVPNPIYGVGGYFNLYAENEYGLKSPEIGLATLAPLPPSTPNILEKGEYLVGTADPNTTVVISYNDIQQRVHVNARGEWRVENAAEKIGSMFITIHAENNFGMKSATTSFPYFIAGTSVTEKTEFLAGQAKAGTIVFVAYNDVVERIVVDESGQWRIENPLYISGGQVHIWSENQYGVRSSIEHIYDILPLIPTAPTIIENGEYLAGTADANSVVVLRHNGVETRIEVGVDGQWSVLNPIYGVGGSLYLYAENEYGLKSPEIGLATLPPLPPSVPNILETGEYLVGTADADSVVVLRHNGVETRIEVNADGHWSVLNPIYGVGGSLYLYAENQFGIKSLEIGLAALKIIPTSPSVLENTEILAGLADPQHKIIVTSQNEEYVTYSNAEGHWQMENPIKNGGFASIVAENIYGTKSQPYAVVKLQIQTLEVHELVDLGGLLTQVEDQRQQVAQEFVAEVDTTLIDLLDSESYFETILFEQTVSNRVETSVEISLQRHDPIYDPFTQTQWVA